MQLSSKSLFLILAFLLLHCTAWSQQVIVGKILDSKTREAIPGATIQSSITHKVSVSDKNGLFKFTPKPNDSLHISFVSYCDTTVYNAATSDTLIIPLVSKIAELEAVTITSENKTQQRQSGLVTLRMKEMKEIATLFGAADPLKLLQLKPGMALANEGDGGIYVRGGDNGQNLVLLEGIPLHSPTHLLGFYSVFNESATREITLYKSAPPARYGGKLSSVIAVNMPNSADSLIEGDISAGLISSALTLKGTTQNKRFFYLFSARQAYLGLIKEMMKPIPASTSMLNNTNYNFADYYSLLRFHATKKSSLTLAAYLGNDHYFFTNPAYDIENKMNWGNAGTSLQWNTLLDNNLSTSLSASYSQYNFKMNGTSEQATFELSSYLAQWNLKAEVQKRIKETNLNAGFEYSINTLKPNRFQLQTGEDEIVNKQTYHSLLYTPYIQMDWARYGNWMLSTGLRAPFYSEVGPSTKFDSARDTSYFYPKGKVIYSKFILEPRVNLAYQLNQTMTLKTSWSRLSQTLHQIPVGSVSLPTDFWLNASTNRQPSIAEQYTLGWFANYFEKGWEFSAEAYYRKMSGLVELNMIYFNNPSPQSLDANLFTGKGYSYGIEFYMKKRTEHYLGWISYVYSRSYRHFDELQSSFYPAKYDRPHDLKIVQRYIFSPKWTFSAVWVFASGNTLSLPTGRHLIQGNMVNNYGEINNFRLPSYHRLDVSATRNIQWFKYKGELNFSIYNLYNRANPYFYYYRATGNMENYYLKVKLKRVSLFPILPSISLKFYF
jgi:hypothetical protein